MAKRERRDKRHQRWCGGAEPLLALHRLSRVLSQIQWKNWKLTPGFPMSTYLLSVITIIWTSRSCRHCCWCICVCFSWSKTKSGFLWHIGTNFLTLVCLIRNLKEEVPFHTLLTSKLHTHRKKKPPIPDVFIDVPEGPVVIIYHFRMNWFSPNNKRYLIKHCKFLVLVAFSAQ